MRAMRVRSQGGWGRQVLLAGLGIVCLAYLGSFLFAWAAIIRMGHGGISGKRQVEEGARILSLIAGGPAERAGLRVGDLILVADGVSAADEAAMTRLSLSKRPGDSTTIVYRREDPPVVRETTFVLETVLSEPDAILSLFAVTLAGVLFLGVGVFTVLVRPQDPAVPPLLLGASSFAAVVALPTALYLPAELFHGVNRGLVVVFNLFCAALLHLFLVFPAPPRWLQRLERRARRRARILGVGGFYAVPLGVAIVAMVVDPGSAGAFGLGLALLAAGIVVLLSSYRRATAPLARAQIKWILWALALGLISFFVAGFASAATGDTLRWVAQLLPILTLGLFPVSLGVAVLRYRLFNIDAVVRASVTYGVLAGILVAGYLVVSFTLSRVAAALLLTGTASDPAVAVLATLAVATVANPARLRLQRTLDRWVYRERLARARFLEEAAVLLGRAQPLAAVAELLTEQVAARLDLAHAWLVLPQTAFSAHRSGATSYAPPPSAPLFAQLRDRTEPVLLVAGGDVAASGLWALAADTSPLTPWYVAGARALIPLRRGGGGADAVAPGDDPSTASRPPGDLVGVWALGERRSREPFQREDLEALGRVADQAAVLLDYARLYDELLAQEVTRRELAHAWEIQQRLLPEQLDGWPNLLQLAARFRPARETSGDFYDLFELHDSAGADGARRPLQIAVGDVAGKGLGAALIMALARATLRAVADTGEAGGDRGSAPAVMASNAGRQVGPVSPAATLRQTGRLLHQDVGRRDFVACALAVVEPPVPGRHSVRIRLSNAGQVPPLLCRAGQAIELAPPGDRLPLGILAEPAYEEIAVDLEPGDAVLFASDGLPEAPARVGGSAPAGELFGFERLGLAAAYHADHTASAEGVASGVWADVTRWCGAESQHDDMTLLVLRVPHDAAEARGTGQEARGEPR